MNIDAESLMQEYSNLVAQLSARAATLAGENGALKKTVVELEAKLAALENPPKE